MVKQIFNLKAFQSIIFKKNDKEKQCNFQNRKEAINEMKTVY